MTMHNMRYDVSSAIARAASCRQNVTSKPKKRHVNNKQTTKNENKVKHFDG